MPQLYPRFIEEQITTALQDTPVVCVIGPRQIGKTTLCKQIAPDRAYFSFDDQTILQLAKSDPQGFVASLPGRVTLDEIQRVPELLFAIKHDVDQNRHAGRYLLTGSANLLLMSQVKESLAGRIEIVHMHPLSEAEKSSHRSNFLELLLSQNITGELSPGTTVSEEIATRLCQGGYPEPLTRTANRAKRWYEQYLNSLIQHDVRDIATIYEHGQLLKLTGLMALRTGQLLNVSTVANELKLTRESVDKYLAILEHLFLFYRLPAWHSSRTKRLIKTPKVHIIDSGLAAMFHQLAPEQWMTKSQIFGQLLESFVLQQIRVQASWLDRSLSFSHYRDKDQKEVDIVIEDGSDVYGIEIKKSSTIQDKDGTGLRILAAQAGANFKGGVIFYSGQHTLPLPLPNCFAVPITQLWR